MTRSRSLGRWDPFDMLTSLWSSAAAAPPISSGAAATYQTLFVTLRRLIVGRTLVVRLDNGDVRLTVTKFDSRFDVRRLAVGQLNDVRVIARDIWWDESRFEQGTAVLHNVHLRPSSRPVLVAAPVEMSLELPGAALDSLFRWAMPRLAGEVDADGVARLRWARRPAMGNLEVDVRLDGSTLWLKPRGLALRRRRWALPSRVPAYPVRLRDLPRGLQLTNVDLSPGLLRVSGTLPEWRMEVSRRHLEDILTQLSSVGRTLNLTKSGRRR